MILHEWLTMGFGATVVLTAIMAGAQGLKYTRMSIPYLLGTMFTKDRDRARVVGILAHAALLVFLRLSGKRTLAKMNAFDLVGPCRWALRWRRSR